MPDSPPHAGSKGDADEAASAPPGREPETGTPRWVRVFAIIGVVLVALFVIRHLTEGSLGRHTP